MITEFLNSISVKDPKAVTLFEKYEFLSQYHFNDFIKHENDPLTFSARFHSWLLNFKDEDEKIAFFRLFDYFFYVSRKEFNHLYRSSFSKNIKLWLLALSEINPISNDVNLKLDSLVADVWFTSCTDSFNLHEFCKVNDISQKIIGIEWRGFFIHNRITLKEIDKNETIYDPVKKILVSNKVKMIVVLEDFVGTGTQSSNTIMKLCNIVTRLKESGCMIDLNILFVPIIICPTGVKHLRELCIKFDFLKVSPVIVLPDISFLGAVQLESSYCRECSLVLSKYNDDVFYQSSLSVNVKKSLGYGEMGVLFSKYSNTPNNSLPIFWHKSSKWFPLFERVSRDL